MSETLNQERIWERGWEGHELAQLRRMASLPLWEKLDWLEEAHEFVLQLQAGQSGKLRNRSATNSSPATDFAVVGSLETPPSGYASPLSRKAP